MIDGGSVLSVTPTENGAHGDGCAPLRVALVGYGVGGRFYVAPYIQAACGFELTVVITSRPSRAEQARAELPGTEVCPSLEKLLERHEVIDLVVVSTPNASHRVAAQAVLNAQLDVVIDKPLAVTSADAFFLADLASQRGQRAIPYLNRRWDSDFQAIAAEIASGTVGEVHTFESRIERWRPYPKSHWVEQLQHEQGGGILHGLGIHLIDQALTLFGPVTAVRASGRCVRAHRVPDEASLTLLHHNGIQSLLFVSDHIQNPGPRFRVTGSAGALESYGMDPQEAAIRSGLRPVHLSRWRDTLAARAPWIVNSVTGLRARAMPTSAMDYWAQLRDALTANADPPVSINAAIEGVRVLETTWASWCSSAWVPHMS